MKVYLYVLEWLSDWEIGYITAELVSGRYLLPEFRGLSFIKIASTLDPVTTLGGIKISPEMSVDQVTFESGDVIILPGSHTWQDALHTEFPAQIPVLLSQGVTIAGICGATVALAWLGVLDARKHTSNDLEFLQMMCPQYQWHAYYDPSPAVTDDNLITASGLAPLEFSRALFHKMSVMKPEVLEAWYQLHVTRDPSWFFVLMQNCQ